MAIHKLSENFKWFFKRLNPSPSYVAQASSAQQEVRRLIEAKEGPAEHLKILTFIQGSYGRDTAIHTINDVDVVAVANLERSASANRRTRDQLFETIATSILENKRYCGKVQYGQSSMCVKVIQSNVKIEVLPALRRKGFQQDSEPFEVFGQPSRVLEGTACWHSAFAREHQERISSRNREANGMLVPMIKVVKHLRSQNMGNDSSKAPSFLIECLMYALMPRVYSATVADCIERVLASIGGFDPLKAISSGMRTPCMDKEVFKSEWATEDYRCFHQKVSEWHTQAAQANNAVDRDRSIALWKSLLGESYFPQEPNSQ